MEVGSTSAASAPKKNKGEVCCVVGCSHTQGNSPGIAYYSFPTNPNKLKQRQEWIKAVKRVNPDGSPWVPNNRSRICSRHFAGNAKSDHPLSPSFVPMIFPAQYLQNKTESAISSALKRFDRFSRKQKSNNDEGRVIKEKLKKMTEEQDVFEANDHELGIPIKTFEDKGNFVNFLAVDAEYPIFICNRYIDRDNKFCEAETQVTFGNRVSKSASKKLNLVDKQSGNDISYADACVGPEDDVVSRLKCDIGFHGRQSIESDQAMLDLTGTTILTFTFLLDLLCDVKGEKLPKENRLLLFLIKMKIGLTSSALGVLFNIHRTTATRIFHSVLEHLSQSCRNLVSWPSREAVRMTMPDVFKESYSDCCVIIDCTEFKVEQPPEVSQRVYMFSHYKKGFTIKILVGCTPSGYISFISKAFGGRTTDAQITNLSGFLNLLEPGDVVLADKGFPEIKTVLNDSGKGILLVMPPFLKNGQFTADEVNETKKVAKVRIHVERVMQRLRTYNILSKFTIKMLPYADNIIFMCAVLVNLQPPIIKVDENC